MTLVKYAARCAGVMLAVKSQYSAATCMIAPLLAPDATVLSAERAERRCDCGCGWPNVALLALVDFASDSSSWA